MRTARLITTAVVIALTWAIGKAMSPAGREHTSGTNGVTTMEIDSLRLTTIRDDAGEKRMPNKLFYGKTDSAKVERLSPEGSVASSVSCFLVETRGMKVLFDTGNGQERGGMLLQRLEEIGVSPRDIDYLVITHFHGDHIGGMMANGKPVFTNAWVYVPEAEYAAWQAMSDKGAKMAMETMKAYEKRLRRFRYTDALPLGIRPMAAPGHTPGHTVYQMGRLFVAGDLFHGFDLQIQDLSICPGYDMNRRQAAASREKYVEYVKTHKLVMAGMHLPGNGVKEEL